MTGQSVVDTLERASVRGDLNAGIYGRLFALHPEMETQFIRDTDGAVRGEMLARVFEIIIDVAEGRAWAARMIQCEFVTHDGYGVPPDVFGVFFRVVAAEIEAVPGADWSATDTVAWEKLLTTLNWFATHSDQSLAVPVG